MKIIILQHIKIEDPGYIKDLMCQRIVNSQQLNWTKEIQFQKN